MATIEALKYKSRTEFASFSGSAYNYARRTNILDMICKHMNPVRIQWETNVEELRKEALKYSTRSEFKQANPYAYRFASKKGLLPETCKHMALQVRESYTLDEIKQEASKYNNRRDFGKYSNKYYRAAVRNGWLELACLNMKYPADSSLSEVDIFNLIKNKYPKTQKLKDRKAEIAGKSHIKGFDIDVYVPELRKGIEFDGTYWHNGKGLRRGRPNWPQEDLADYHRIKDDYFRSKGITLLHVKQEEWIQNKEDCLNKIFTFLSQKD